LQDQHRIQPDMRTPRLLSVLFPDRGKKPTCSLQLLVKSMSPLVEHADASLCIRK
jgi:hypothetical protein